MDNVNEDIEAKKLPVQQAMIHWCGSETNGNIK